MKQHPFVNVCPRGFAGSGILDLFHLPDRHVRIYASARMRAHRYTVHVWTYARGRIRVLARVSMHTLTHLLKHVR